MKWSIVLGLLAGAVPMGVVACSLGEGVTPTCNPDLPPDDPNACFQVAACDNGNGGVKAEEGCCVEAGNQQYGVCNMADIAGDFRDLCVPGGNPPPSGCCTSAQTTFDQCMAGILSGSTGTAGAGGTGGAGGAGGDVGGAGGTGGTGGGGGAGGN